MALNTSRINLDGGIDQAVANQRTRAYVPGDPSSASVSGGQQYGTMWMNGTGNPTSFASGAQTYTAAMLGGGLIVHNTGVAATAATTDTAANILTYMNNNSAGVQVGDIMSCLVMNTGTTGVLTLNAAPPAGITFDGNGVNTIAGGVSKTLNFRCTNVTTPAFVIYM